ncbi:MAG: serine/threonine protein kinase [Deltaproteobacteria bacterium]|nr:serine/threonine protein kinase [Deltaproteobacteria bacterium]MBW1893681.1 serine/threonine protein kinase [Deltaproteobacteria bacterium]
MSSSLTGISFQSAAIFSFVKEIGRGGMGIVYLAEKHSEDVSDLVVLKTILTTRDQQLDSLKREANIAATLRHENIVRTFGLESIPFDSLPTEFKDNLSVFIHKESFEKTRGSEHTTNIRMGLTCAEEDSDNRKLLGRGKDNAGKRLFLIVMEYIDGWDLRKIHSKHIKAGLLLPVKFNAFIISRICRALEYAHQYIVHRDISPENILVNDQGVTKLMDFGLSVAADQETFELAGKIQYMAPEQVLDGYVDNRSDIFSLGLVAYRLLTGISPFFPPSGMNFQQQTEYYGKMLDKEIVPPHEICVDVPEEYSQIVMKMLAVDSSMRYQKIDKVGREIEKKFIYAEGFGPTNNSLAAYLKLFDLDFQVYDDEDLEQLAFMTDDNDEFVFKRKLQKELYTERGRQIMKDRRG